MGSRVEGVLAVASCTSALVVGEVAHHMRPRSIPFQYISGRP
ncbi:hypothetical protein BH11MYX4_BH11MYX4_05670 [soil metagenome]